MLSPPFRPRLPHLLATRGKLLPPLLLLSSTTTTPSPSTLARLHHASTLSTQARRTTRDAVLPLDRRRHFSDQQTFRTRYGTIKLNLTDKKTVGIAQSRGERPYQEDAYAAHSILVPTSVLKSNVIGIRNAAGWSPDTDAELEGYPQEEQNEKDGEERKRQVAYFGVFDGHGGNQVSKYLKDNLHKVLEESNESEVRKVIHEYRKLGGYLRRYRGGVLERFREGHDSGETTTTAATNEPRRGMTLGEQAALAFLKADTAVLADERTGKAGSVATVALLHSLDTPHSHPYYGSSLLSLTIAHLGDTRAILASTSSGRAKPLTEHHHPDSRVESERLRQSGTGIVTDSFGESRWGGTLANTRGVGDREFKALGVIGEPVISTEVFKGAEWAFLVLTTDGITDSMSDQEVVDLCRGISDPTKAAQAIVKFAEDVGGEDNMTAIVVPLPGWGKMGGLDTTSSRREYRLKQNSGQNLRQKRM